VRSENQNRRDFLKATAAAAAGVVVGSQAWGGAARDGEVQPGGGKDHVLTGRVLFVGERPVLEPLIIPEEESQGCVCEGEKVNDENRSYLISEDGGLANVVITVDVPGAELVVPEEPVIVQLYHCRFEPHITIVPMGGTVSFVNAHEISDNVHTYPLRNKSINHTIAVGSQVSQQLARADRIKVKCDLHPWEEAYVVVVDTPYVAVSGPDGRFSIPGLPPGKYQAQAWHEQSGKVKLEISVAEDGSAEPLTIEMGPKKKKPPRRR
jgi:hypothetical protein